MLQTSNSAENLFLFLPLYAHEAVFFLMIHYLNIIDIGCPVTCKIRFHVPGDLPRIAWPKHGYCSTIYC